MFAFSVFVEFVFFKEQSCNIMCDGIYQTPAMYISGWRRMGNDEKHRVKIIRILIIN